MSKKSRHYGTKSRYDRKEKDLRRELGSLASEMASDMAEQEQTTTTQKSSMAQKVQVPVEEIANNEKAVLAMPEKQRLYVLDTNVLLSCVDVLYDKDDEFWREPLNFRPSLKNAHLVIPGVVFDELDHIHKTDHSLRGIVAGKAIDRLMKLFQNSGRKIGCIASLKAPVFTGQGTQLISILPKSKSLCKFLPYTPEQDDNDGWIALTALAATLLHEGATDWSFVNFTERDSSGQDVVLLTNDKALITKADNYGVHTKRYNFDKRPAFTGIRELVVPAKMFEQFYYEERLTQEDFSYYMPDEELLVANEYVVMHPEDDQYPRSYFSTGVPYLNVARYNKGNDSLWPLRSMKYEGKTPPNAGIAAYYDALNDDHIERIVVTGKAGTGKTYSAIIHAINAVKKGRYRRIVIIPSQPAKNPLGALPGKESDKMEPMVAFVKDAIENYLENTPEFQKKRQELRQYGDKDDGNSESDHDYDRPRKKKKDSNGDFYLSKNDKRQLEEEERMSYNDFLATRVKYIYDRYFMALPYEMAQGRTFNDSIIILDEFQRTSVDDAATLLTRIGNNSKLIVCGDVDQIHDSTDEKRLYNGLERASILFFDNERSAYIHLTENMRSETAAIATEENRTALIRLGLWQ